MSEIGIFREGGLPPFPMSFLKIDMTVLRCSYWNVYYWQHDSLLAPYWRIYWNEKPGGKIAFNDQSYDLTPDLIFLIPPNTPFSSELNLNRPRKDLNFLMGCPVYDADEENRPLEAVHHFFVHFTLGLPCDNLSPRIYSLKIDGHIQRIVDELREILSHRKNELDRKALFSIRGLIDLLLSAVPEEDWPNEIMDERIQNSLEYISLNYLEPLKVKELAERVNMSENGFGRLFKKYTGYSPRDYLIMRRLDHASKLLHHSEYSIDQIAMMSGFCDRAYFSRMFSRRFSTGPAKFRKTSFIKTVQSK